MKSKTTTKKAKAPSEQGTTTIRHSEDENELINELAATLQRAVKGLSKNRAIVLALTYVNRQLSLKTLRASDVVVTDDSDA